MLKVLLTTLLVATASSMAADHADAEQVTEPARRTQYLNCEYHMPYHRDYHYVGVEADDVPSVVAEWKEWVKTKAGPSATAECSTATGSTWVTGWENKTFNSIADVDRFRADALAQLGGKPMTRINWSPTGAPTDPVRGERKVKTVFFRDPKPSLGEKGYSNNTFDVEYQFIACSGELHLAYSVMENSVRSKDTTYFLGGSYHKVSDPSPRLENVPLKGAVTYFNTRVGEFADDHAGKALGFGCFSGQSKKIANLKDFRKRFGGGEAGSDDKLKNALNELVLYVETSTVLASTDAEDEIRNGKAKKLAKDYERSGQAGLDAAAADRASRKAASEAKKLKYEQDLAAQQKAVAEFEVAQQQMVAAKAANGARARAVQDEFARQQAVHRAELERHARARAQYEAQVAGQASVTVPKN